MVQGQRQKRTASWDACRAFYREAEKKACKEKASERRSKIPGVGKGLKLPEVSCKAEKKSGLEKENKAMNRKITFRATKRVPQKIKISFETTKGKKISFMAAKRRPKVIKGLFGRKR